MTAQPPPLAAALLKDEIQAIAELAARRYRVDFETRTKSRYPFTEEAAEACGLAVAWRLRELGLSHEVEVRLNHNAHNFRVVLRRGSA